MARAVTSPPDYGVLHDIFMLGRILCQWKVYCVYIYLKDTLKIDGLPLLNNTHTIQTNNHSTQEISQRQTVLRNTGENKNDSRI